VKLNFSISTQDPTSDVRRSVGWEVERLVVKKHSGKTEDIRTRSYRLAVNYNILPTSAGYDGRN